MKNLKILLPMMAIIFVIGVAFATTELKEEPKVQALDYYEVIGTWRSTPEQSCPGTGFTCRVRLGEGGPVYDLYDEMDDDLPKDSSSPDPIIINP